MYMKEVLVLVSLSVIVLVMSGSFSGVPLAPPNSILGIALECKKDPFPNKIDLTIGAYRDEKGGTVVLGSVRAAEKLLLESNSDHEYLAQDGDVLFLECSRKLVLGDLFNVHNKRIASIQGLSGTGSLRLGFEFIKKYMADRVFFIPSVTWPNHNTMLEEMNMPYKSYRYLNENNTAINFDGLIEDIEAAPPKSIILLHACAHNPTGIDPTDEQWVKLLDVIKAKNHIPFFDNAYQGFVSGDTNADAYSIRLFASSGIEMFVACSFAKNFGLYGERIGALHIFTEEKDCEVIPNISSQLRGISRAIYSTCPAYGARLVGTVLSNQALKSQWESECYGMAMRLNAVRRALYDNLVKYDVLGTWEHVINQRGMFSYSGIPAWAVQQLRDRYHIYMISNGRISLAGLNTNNVETFVQALKDILGTNSK